MLYMIATSSTYFHCEINICFGLHVKEKMEKSIRYCKDFVNLKSLDIGKWKFSKDTNLFAFFLRHSPNLQELTLNLDEDEVLSLSLKF